MSPTVRPFYGSFAWAFDLLVERPVVAECEQIGAILARRGVANDAALLDAGCGTGGCPHPGRQGYRVTGLDLSTELIAVARQRRERRWSASWSVTSPSPPRPRRTRPCSAAACSTTVGRPESPDAFIAFARALQPAGVLLLDVRDWDATVRRRTAEPMHERTVETEQGTLVYRAEIRLDHAQRRMLVAERHTLTFGGRTTAADHDFVMRCWTRDELERSSHARASKRSHTRAPTIRRRPSARRTGSWRSPHAAERVTARAGRRRGSRACVDNRG